MNKPNPQVDEFLTKAKRWRDELETLRTILHDCQLNEEFKWRSPCYTFQGKNVAILGELKDCCTLSFFKGALLKDSRGILEKPGENTRAGRVIRFTNVQEINELKPTLKALIQEAITVEKAGLKVDFEEDCELGYPEELQAKFDESPELKTSFESLTPDRQRAYLLFFSAAKQSKTRESRIEKYRERILEGKGLNDCVCGHSQNLPNGDGSHNSIR
jgi:uncharacterized protein YdeI (YjbR/CyaY-like superfamily)